MSKKNKGQNKKAKGNIAQPINKDSVVSDSVFMGDGFGNTQKSGSSSNVKVSGEFDLLPIVIREYTELHNTPSLYAKKRNSDGQLINNDNVVIDVENDNTVVWVSENPNKYNMPEFINYMVKNNHVVLPNGVMCFNALFLALRHTYELNPDTYVRGGGLQCYITSIGSPKNKNGIAHGLVRLLIDCGFSCFDKQYTGRYKKSFMGRMWIIRKPTPKPTPTTE